MGSQPDLSSCPRGVTRAPNALAAPQVPRAVPGWAHPAGDLRAEDPAQEAAEPWPGGVARAAQPVAHGWATATRSLALSLYPGGTQQRPPTSGGLASSGPGQQAGRRELPRFVYSLGGDNKDRDPDSPLHQHLPCLLFSLPLTKFTQEGNSFLPSLYGGRR